jgi:hypothetical protein
MQTAATLLLAAFLQTAGGGEIKVHDWPCNFVPQDVEACSIPVVLDVETAPFCQVTGRSIQLRRTRPGTYEGCSTLTVRCNYSLTIRATVVPSGAVAGDYSASLTTTEFDPPGGVAALCVRLDNAVPGGTPGRRRLRVAVVRLVLSPR